MSMLDVARKKLSVAKESLEKRDWCIAAENGIDAIEFALKYPLRVFGIKYEEEKHRKLHDVRKFYSPEIVNKMSQFLPFLPEYSQEELCKVIFLHTIWLRIRKEIRYGLEEHPDKFASPFKLIDEDLANLIVKHAEKVVSFIGYSNPPIDKLNLKKLRKLWKNLRKLKS